MSLTYDFGKCVDFRVGSHDPFFDPVIIFALFQFIEMLTRVINFFKFE